MRGPIRRRPDGLHFMFTSFRKVSAHWISRGSDVRPNFSLQYFEGSWAGGGIPFSGKPDRKLHLWAKHRCDMNEFPAEKIVAIADIPPPVVLSHFSEPPVPASSLTWSLEFLVPPAEIESDWFYLEFTLEAAAEGYTQQSGRIFTEDGVLCALSRQCMVYFGPAATN